MTERRRRGPPIFRIGDSWKEPELDEDLIAGYRFEPFRHCRWKLALDLFAGCYLAMALATLVASLTGSDLSFPNVLGGIRRAFALGQLWDGRHQVMVFVVLCVAILVHESRWLKLQIYRELLAAGRHLDAISGMAERRPTTPRRRFLTRVSTVINRAFFVGMVLTAASLLWEARRSPRVLEGHTLPNLVKLGVLWTLTGSFALVEALEVDGALFPIALLRMAAGAVLSGIAFASIVAVGLRHGARQGTLGFVFGVGLASSAWLWRYLVVRPRREHQPSPRTAKIRRYAVQIPLIAIGNLLDPCLRVLAALLTFVQKGVERVASWILSLVPVLPDSWRRALERVGHASDFERFNEENAERYKAATFEIVRTGARGISYGYQHPVPAPLPVFSIARMVQSRFLRSLFEGDSWLTRWMKREPVRPFAAGTWEREDPLGFEIGEKRIRHFSARTFPKSEAELLYRRLVALMLAAFLAATMFEMLVGHVVTFYGRALFVRGIAHAAIVGLIIGALFAMLTAFGEASLGALVLGLVSGLSLDPTLGVAEGLRHTLEQDHLIYALTLVVGLAIGMLERRAVLVTGALMFSVGIYLQYLPFLIHG